MKTEKIIATFIISLIIMFPIYSASALALTINSLHGEAGLDDFRRGNDYTVFNVTATTDNVRLYSPIGDIQFFDCDPEVEEGERICMIQYPSNGYDYHPGNSVSYQIMEKFGSEIIDQELATISIDGSAPTITIMNSSSTNRKLAIEFKLSDPVPCSGNNRVVFNLGDVSKEVLINQDPGDCIYEGSTNITANVDGYLELSAETYDNIENTQGLTLGSYALDSQSPEVSNLLLIRGGDVLEHISTQGMHSYLEDVTVVVSIEEDSDQLSAVADLSSLTNDPILTQAYGSVIGTCDPVLSHWECTFGPITIDLEGSGQLTISVNLQVDDYHGHLVELTATSSLTTDNDGPVVMKVYTDYTDGSNYFIKKGSEVIHIDLTEQGSGLDHNSIYLNLFDFNTDLYNAGPVGVTQCYDYQSHWTCSGIMEVSDLESGDVLFADIVSPSRDDVNNPAIGETTNSIIYDENIPYFVENLTITTTDGLPYFKAGDRLVITAITDDADSGVEFAIADLSDILEDGNNLTTECTTDGDYYKCVWNTNPIWGPVTAGAISITIYDFVGNGNQSFSSSEGPIPFVEIYELLEGAEASFWEVDEVIISPPYIDKQITEIMQRYAYAYIKLNSIGSFSDLEIVDFSSPICQPAHSELAGPIELLNDNQGSTTPVIRITFEKASIGSDQLEFNCSIDLVSRLGYTIHDPEHEEFTFAINFTNFPLGTLPDALKEEVDSIINSDLVQEKGVFFMLGEGLTYVQAICSVVGVITSLSSILDTIFLIASPLQKTPLGYISTMLKKIAGIGIGSWKTTQVWNKWACGVASCSIAGDIMAKISPNIDPVKYQTFANIMYKDPHASIVASIFQFCIPGVYYNLQKARQLECKYVQCAQEQVRDGVPPSYCKMQRSYDWCKIVYTQEMLSIPLAGLWNHVIKAFKAAMRDPITLAYVGFAEVCHRIPEDTSAAACTIIPHIESIQEFWGHVTRIMNFQMTFVGDVDYCTGLSMEGDDD